MQFNTWWGDDPTEIFWLEITDRPDIGVDLHAPKQQENHTEYYGYSLITEIQPDDTIFHYHKDERAIVYVSSASGSLWEDEIIWAAHGTTARDARVTPYRRAGWRRGLSGGSHLSNAVGLSELRSREPDIRQIYADLSSRITGSLYFPFELSNKRPLRPTQAYITKLPASLVNLFPALVASLSSSVGNPLSTSTITTTQPGIQRVGTSYRPANELTSISQRRPMEVDPAYIERATRGHASTQNKLAIHLVDKGYAPLSPRRDEPNFDIAWIHNGEVYVAEIKSITPQNEEQQLRMGLGQVLHYKYRLQSMGMAVHAVLMTERQPTDLDWVDLCKRLDVKLTWPNKLAVDI